MDDMEYALVEEREESPLPQFDLLLYENDYGIDPEAFIIEPYADIEAAHREMMAARGRLLDELNYEVT